MNTITFSTVSSNGLKMRVAEAGSGPLVILAHGWPESWYSWRHQLTALADAGYHAIAPDMRGYGDTDAPPDVADYRVDHLAADLVGLADHFGAARPTLVGHDWGANAVWHAALLHPQRFNGVVGLSVPYWPRGETSLTTLFKAMHGDNFFYILYHNEPGGVAEAEYDSRPRDLIERMYTSPDTPRDEPLITDPLRSAGGFVDRIGAPKELAAWLTAEDVDYYVGEFERAGFRGGVNYYRNFDANWSLMADVDPIQKIPAAFIAGSEDMVINGADQAALQAGMSAVIPDLRGVTVIPDVGHWVQQEAPEATNAAIIEFLRSLD
ncbi:MAG: alpha/beta hydrolase [Pseudomonadota bacterium]